jgi:hypothetical protein
LKKVGGISGVGLRTNRVRAEKAGKEWEGKGELSTGLVVLTFGATAIPDTTLVAMGYLTYCFNACGNAKVT